LLQPDFLSVRRLGGWQILGRPSKPIENGKTAIIGIAQRARTDAPTPVIAAGQAGLDRLCCRQRRWAAKAGGQRTAGQKNFGPYFKTGWINMNHGLMVKSAGDKDPLGG
jgi:hypothetical protein